MRGLGADVEAYYEASDSDSSTDEEGDDIYPELTFASGLETTWFRGARASSGLGPITENAHLASGMQSLVEHLNSCGPGVDIVECSGGPHASTFAVRRVLPTHKRVDVVTHTNLHDHNEHRIMWAYFRHALPMIAVLRVPLVHGHSDPDGLAHARLLGAVASHQQRSQRHFICERAVGNDSPGDPSRDDHRLTSSSVNL